MLALKIVRRNKVLRLKSTLHGIDSISDWSGKILSYIILVISFIILIEVVCRYLLNNPTAWAHELSQYLFGTYAIMGGAYTLLYRAHVNMDIFYSRFSLRKKAVIDVFTSVFFFFWCGILLWYGSKFAAGSIGFWEHSTTAWGPPVWEVKLMIPLAAFLIILQGLAKFVRDLHIFITGRELE